MTEDFREKTTISPAKLKILDFKRSQIEKGLKECAIAQREFFYRLYPEGIMGMSEKKLDFALGQIERTIQKNQSKLGETENLE